MTTNLYRIDDVLLRGGFVIAPFALLVVSGAVANVVEHGSLSLPATLFVILLVSCPLAMLTIGWRIRKHEKRVLKLWRFVAAQGQVPIQQLLKMNSYSRKQLAAAVDRINNRGNGTLVWDDADAVIRDVSVQEHRMTHTEQCQSCGGNVNIEVTTGRSNYTCPFCGGGLDCGRINLLLDSLQQRAQQDEQTEPGQVGDRINLPLFIILMVVFWPAAVAYAIKVYHSQNSGTSRLSVQKTTFEQVYHTTRRTHRSLGDGPAEYVTTTTTLSKKISHV